MKPTRYFITLLLALLLAGCSRSTSPNWHLGTILYVFHGQIEIQSQPQFEWRFNSDVSVKCFDRMTAVQLGNTNYIIGLPYYVLLVGAIAPFALVIILWARRKTSRGEPENS
jgi:hypothetical protein